MSREVCNHNVLIERSCQECIEESQARNVSPSPEARVDWELEADKILKPYIVMATDEGGNDMRYLAGDWEDLSILLAKALSAAFEKGREAR